MTDSPKTVMARAFMTTHRKSAAIAKARDQIAALHAVDYEIVQGWQPIETAPRDGTIVLLSNLTDGYVEFGWFVAPCEMDDSLEDDEPDWFTKEGEYLGSVGKSDTAPTHYKPLPAPPAEEG